MMSVAAQTTAIIARSILNKKGRLRAKERQFAGGAIAETSL
jgi:hypothetical protein